MFPQVFNTFYHYEEIKAIVRQLSCLTRSCVLSARQRSTFHEVEVENKLAGLIYSCPVVISSTTGLVMMLIGESGRDLRSFKSDVIPSGVSAR